MSHDPSAKPSPEKEILLRLDAMKESFNHLVELCFLNQATLQALAEEMVVPDRVLALQVRGKELYEELQRCFRDGTLED